MKFAISTGCHDGLPSFIEASTPLAEGEFLEAVKDQRSWIREALRVHGALYFRGFGQMLESFDDLASVLFPELPPFNPALPGVFTRRSSLAKDVVDSTYLWKRVPMSVHNEFNYLPIFPRYIGFRCLEAPAAGGETAIADCRKIYAAIDPEVRDRFENGSVKYTRNFYEKRLASSLMNKFIKLDESWKEVFRTEERSEVEQVCRDYDVEFSWGKGNSLQIQCTLPAVRDHPDTREKVWFNQAAPWVFHPRTTGWLKFAIYNIVYPGPGSKPIAVSYGAGVGISPADAAHVIEVVERNTVKVEWAIGDTLICDNYLVAHGRMPYRGTRVLATIMR